MSSRIDLPITASAWVGFLAALPWLLLALFNLVLAGAYGLAFLLLVPVALAGAAYHWNLLGRLCLERSVVRLTFPEGSEGELQVQQRNNEEYAARPDSASRLYPRLAILKLNPVDATNRPCTVLLWASGNISGDLHRQLRARLRLGSASDRPGQNH